MPAVQNATNGKASSKANGVPPEPGMIKKQDARTKLGYRWVHPDIVADQEDYTPPARKGSILQKELMKGGERHISIKPPDIRTIEIPIVGTAPFVQNRFANKEALMKKHSEGGSSRGKRNLAPKDFDVLYEAAKHISEEGWCGIPAPAFRAAMISACRLVGFQMSKAKLSIFVIGDGFDKEDGTPLIKITGVPEKVTHPVRNSTGVVDIRARPMWRRWLCTVKIQYDADQFKEEDVANLLLRAGMQVGVGEGRPDSKNSAGMGWGTFTINDQGRAGGAKGTRKTSRVSKAN
jgi:hypothetical protein